MQGKEQNLFFINVTQSFGVSQFSASDAVFSLSHYICTLLSVQETCMASDYLAIIKTVV
jgi:hypothetical protein